MIHPEMFTFSSFFYCYFMFYLGNIILSLFLTLSLVSRCFSALIFSFCPLCLINSLFCCLTPEHTSSFWLSVSLHHIMIYPPLLWFSLLKIHLISPCFSLGGQMTFGLPIALTISSFLLFYTSALFPIIF